MFKSNKKLFLFTLIFSAQLSLHNSFAMDDDIEEINRRTTNIQNKFINYQNRVLSLEQELNSTGALIGQILNATPSVLNYLRACANNNTTEEQLQNLRRLASQDQTFPDLITSASKQIRGKTPESTRRLSQLSNVALTTTSNLNTITYAQGRINGTQEETVNNLEDGVRRVLNRTTPTTQRTQTTTQITQIPLNLENAGRDQVDEIIERITTTNLNTENNNQ